MSSGEVHANLTMPSGRAPDAPGGVDANESSHIPKFLGLPVRRPELTDEQYIEQLRKKLRRMRLLAWFFILLAEFQIVLLVFCLVLVHRWEELIRGLTSDPNDDGNLNVSAMRAGLVIGISLGFFVSSIISGIIAAVIHAYQLFKRGLTRSEKLAIEYHDLIDHLLEREDTRHDS
ncbi:MAG: hypothetical protein GC162_06755 [Planctomycetes bacterium]|nr:hypothetical protein [Planctomycetota bacterium]